MPTTKKSAAKSAPFYVQDVSTKHSVQRSTMVRVLADFVACIMRATIFNKKSKLVKLVTEISKLYEYSRITYDECLALYVAAFDTLDDETLIDMWCYLMPAMPTNHCAAGHLRDLIEHGSEASWYHLYLDLAEVDKVAMQRFEDIAHATIAPMYYVAKEKAKRDAEDRKTNHTKYEQDYGDAIKMLHAAGIKFITAGAHPGLQEVVTKHTRSARQKKVAS